MIHFFPTFSNDASRSPFALELAASGVEHRLLAYELRLHYKSRLWLLFVGWPRLLFFALRAAWRSQRSVPRPDMVVLNSDIEVLVFGALRAVRIARLPRIAMLGFIYTRRRGRVSNALRKLYFRVVFAFADTVICHSAFEVDDYRRMFAGTRARFVYVPYGLHVAGRESISSVAAEPRYVLAAGRSGRDYRTLCEAVRGRDVHVRIVCDSSHALVGLDIPDNVTVLRECYGGDYLRELAGASVVVVPLAVDNISAGQMVMLQAMSFGKPVIITQTATIQEYVTDGREATFVPRGDPAAMHRTIQDLLASPERAEAMGNVGRQTFEDKFSMRSYVRNVLAAL
jgi:glycosyltransferase involved in cell wall biosynthesis